MNFYHLHLKCEIFHTCLYRRWGPPSLLYSWYQVFPGGKAAGAWHWPPTPSSAKVKERVELYLYSTSGPSWPAIGWTLPTPGIFICIVDFSDEEDEDTKPLQNIAVYRLTQHSSIPVVLSLPTPMWDLQTEQNPIFQSSLYFYGLVKLFLNISPNGSAKMLGNGRLR